jgi:signal transduction histidine kinase
LPLTTEQYPEILAARIDAERIQLSSRWLDRLRELLPVNAREVFPTQDLLDHIPSLLGEIARYLRAPDVDEIAANTAVMEKARELGLLRHGQRASAHQLLREYEILAELLEEFVAVETERLGLEPSSTACLDAMRRLMRAVRTLMRTTVDTFISEYTSTIESQAEHFRSFARLASHELRTPLGTIVFATRLLERDAWRDPLRLARVRQTIDDNVGRLTSLLTTLQRVAQLDGSVDTPSQQVVELAAMANEVVRQLDEMAKTRGVTIHVDPNLPALLVDPSRFELVLLNLVSNALKYSDPDKPSRWVRIDLVARASDTCTICVRDNGLGIPADAQPEIFRRFFRAHTALDDQLNNDGAGLGLAIVAECLQALGGTITCESHVGTGTSFRINLPNKRV